MNEVVKAEESGLMKKVTPSSSITPIQTYSPQLNLSLYSPATTPVSTISRFPSSLAASSSSSCLKDTSTVQNSTLISSIHKPLYSTPSSSIASTLKMDIRSPPQPSQSTSRLMNAFQRLRGNGRNQVLTNSVAPAEISIKPNPSKSTLANKIKTKFQQLDKKKRISLPQPVNNHRNNSIVNKRSTLPPKSMPRSTSLSSITQWSSRLTSKANESSQTKKMSQSSSVSSFLSSKTGLSSSSSSSSNASGYSQTSNNRPAFTLTKSISSHRIYKNSGSPTEASRPRQPLRAINPNDSVRFSQQQQAKEKGKSRVRFSKLVSVRETFSKIDYDRGSDPEAVCSRLTPTLAQEIKDELNAYKLHEMQVHEFSRVHTHFFL